MLWIDEANCPKNEEELLVLAQATIPLSAHANMLKLAVDEMTDYFAFTPERFSKSPNFRQEFLENYANMQAKIYTVRALLYDCLDYIDLLQNNETESARLLDATIQNREKIKQLHRRIE